MAQTAPAEPATIETVIVTGIRGSLQRSLDLKRDAVGVVDAISMEDIGKFPDSNLAAALMRIPGVTITRAQASNMGPTTTGQATEVTVRGMGPTFNETLFNGRRIPSALGGRAFDFSGLSADMVSALEVYKSPDATLSAGAIGATINVKYPNPFDKDGLTLSAAVSTDYGPDDGRFSPNGNFLFSDTFFGGKLGVLVAGAYSKLATTQLQVSNWGWIGQHIYSCQYTSTCTTAEMTTKDTSKAIWFTQDLSYDYNQIQEERKNARISVQFQPMEKLLVTVDGNFSRDSIYENQYAFAIWNNGDEMRNVKTSSHGTVTDFTRNAPTDFDDNSNYGIQQTYDAGINAKYDVSNHLTLIFDYDLALSSLNPGDHITSASADVGYGSSSANGTNSTTFEVIQPGGKSLPYYKNYGPNGDASRFEDVTIIGSHDTTAAAQRNRNAVNQFKAEGIWTDDNLTVKFGGNYVADHYHMNYYGPWTNSRWEAWAGYGPDSNNPTGVDLPDSLFTGTVKLSSMPGWDSSNEIPTLLKFSQKAVWKYLDSLGVPTAATGAGSIAGFNWGCCLSNGKTTYTGMDPNKIISFDPGSFQQVFEDSYSAFTSVATETKFGGMPLKVNLGIRYEYTSVKSTGIDQPLTGLSIMPGDESAYSYTMGDAKQTSETNSYQYLLPNVDLNLQVTDDLQVRFDVSRTMTRPNLSDLKPNKSSWGGRKGALGVTGGNPDELPFLSDNIDLGVEWYYAPNSYAAASVFAKNISNFVVTGTSTLTLDDVIDPNTGSAAVFTLTQPKNGPTANVYGLELMWQHMFGDSGFGYQLNGTIVQSDKPYNPNNLSTNAFAITGLSDSANFVGFYDKDGFEIRFAANWRDTYLDKFGQDQSSGTQFGSEPVFVDGTWTLDASTSYNITDNINVYFEATNLMDVAYSTRGRYSDQVLNVVSIGRRFTAGVHFKL